MPVYVKKSVNYTNQQVRVKELGLGGEIKIFSYAVPNIGFCPIGGRFYEGYTVVDPAGSAKLSVYTGLDFYDEDSLFAYNGYLFNPGSTLWNEQFDPVPGENVRFAYAAVTTSDGNLMIIGGVSDLLGEGATQNASSNVYDLATKSWSEAYPMLDFPVGQCPIYLKGRAAETDFQNNRTFVFTRVLDEGAGQDAFVGSYFHVWDGIMWQTLDTNAPIVTEQSDSLLFTQMLSMGVRNDEANSVVLIHTGSFTDTKFDQSIWKWVQNSSAPVSGTWTEVTGSVGSSPDYENPMPMGTCGLMWEANRNRWTAVTAAPDLFGSSLGLNMWTSETDGSSWSTHNFNYGDYTTDLEDVDPPLRFPTIVPDPTRNQFYFLKNTLETGLNVWLLTVAENPSDSTLVLLHNDSSCWVPPSPPP